MGTLTDKLKSLGVKIGARDLPPPRPRRGPCIEEVVRGRVHATAYGEAYVVETSYPSDYHHGRAALAVTSSLQTIAEWASEPRLVECDPGRLVFLDVETTGLAGGTGTYAFLVGLGRYDGDPSTAPSPSLPLRLRSGHGSGSGDWLRAGTFRLTQIFMRDPIEEPALLAALTQLLAPAGALVTFNGKAFDVPLLNSRYVLNGQESPLTSAAHLDLLPLARRLWRERLESRALGSLEMHILGAMRTAEDIPGWLIPQMYFDYLESDDARPLAGVFYHNAMDVVAMAALLSHIAQMLDDPLTFAFEHGLDLIAIGRLFEDLGRLDDAARLYARAMEHDVSEEVFRATVRRLSFVQRRRGEISSAVELWREAARTEQIYAYVELAKYYEHQVRDYAEAAQWTRAALAIVSAPDLPLVARVRWMADLEHRLARLEKKGKGIV